MSSVSYERELGTMNAKIENIESNIHDIKQSLDDLPEKLDLKYAKLTDLKNVKSDIFELKGESKWVRAKIFALTKDLSIIAGIIYMLYKVQL